jgi:hypothetical protein
MPYVEESRHYHRGPVCPKTSGPVWAKTLGPVWVKTLGPSWVKGMDQYNPKGDTCGSHPSPFPRKRREREGFLVIQENGSHASTVQRRM